MKILLFATALVSSSIGLSVAGPATPAGEAGTPRTPAAPVTEITPTAADDVPAAVRQVVEASRPGIVIAEAELKEREGRRYYDVEGTLGGEEIELDLLETAEGWQVVEIQRDLAWEEVPHGVQAAVRGARADWTPVRVIESRQAADDSIIYEFFAEGQPATPALEVQVKDEAIEVLKEAWPH